MTMRGQQTIVNQTSKPLTEIHFTLDKDYKTTIEMPGAKLSQDDQRLLYQIYALTTPMQPGESRVMNFTLQTQARGFENSLTNRAVLPNGTFIHSRIVPQIGYQAGNELDDKNNRKRFGLKEKDLMPALEQNCDADCLDSYISNNSDWVNVETVISTSPDQIAIAPGSLKREWNGNGRRYFQYKLDHFALNFYSFLSARYEVARTEWNGIDDRGLLPERAALERSQDAQLGEEVVRLLHHQLRTVSAKRGAHHRVSARGHVRAGVSRNHALLRVDRLHRQHREAGRHRHGLLRGGARDGASVVGTPGGRRQHAGRHAALETLAQYSALMVMEKEYGRDTMRKFMQYEMDNYLRSRGTERLKERPLMRVEAHRGTSTIARAAW